MKGSGVKRFVNILFVALIIICTSKTCAMADVPMTDVEPVQTIAQEQVVDLASIPTDGGICHLARLPIDVMNRIAQLLPFNDRETEAKFIERTSCISKAVPCQYYEHLLAPLAELSSKQRGIGVGFCPDKTKFVFVQLLWTIEPELLTIFDIKQGRKTHGQYICGRTTPLIALSQCGQMFAIIKMEVGFSEHHGCQSFKPVLFLENTVTKKTEEFSIPDRLLQVTSVGFNKQGTHIIVYGLDGNKVRFSPRRNDFTGKLTHHFIFPLESDAKIIEEKSEKKLDDYFKRRPICKKILANISDVSR
jgi:hypothetical protein